MGTLRNIKRKQYSEKMVLGLVVAAATYFGAPALLSTAGFTGAGIAAGSAAAAVQSAVYGGATGGVFATLQAAGAAGVGKAALAGAAAAAGAAAEAYEDYRYESKNNKRRP